MNEVIAEIRINDIFVPFIHVSKLPIGYKSSQVIGDEPEDYSDLLLDQGFVWYQDFIAFNMLRDYLSYWIKIEIKDCLEIDPVIVNAKELGMYVPASVILLPFQITSEERVCVFGDDPVSATFSFTLPAGHYQLLFQNRDFTREEIEAEPNFNCENMDYDKWEDQMELCLLTFIPTKEPIEAKILTYRSELGTKDFSNQLIIHERKMYQDSDD